jgi:hypothetical protein
MAGKGAQDIPAREKDLVDRSRKGRPVERRRVEVSTRPGKGKKGRKEGGRTHLVSGLLLFLGRHVVESDQCEGQVRKRDRKSGQGTKKGERRA